MIRVHDTDVWKSFNETYLYNEYTLMKILWMKLKSKCVASTL